MERIADFRTVFAEIVVARARCSGNRALQGAFARVPRHDFLGPGPWAVCEDGTRTATDDPALAYQDIGIGLAPGIPTGLPSLHAAFLHAAQVASGARVMHVGAGTGYFTAILAELVGASGHVDAYEIDDALAARARDNLAPWPWASVSARSGVRAADAPVDLVYVNAGVQQLPRAWIDAVSPGGCVVFPLVAAGGAGAVFLIRRGERDIYAARFLGRAGFVPCIGAQDEASSARLTEAFRSDRCESVRSLRLAPDAPDDTAWFAGDGWWLSTAPLLTDPPPAG